jgi:hypothetical protein
VNPFPLIEVTVQLPERSKCIRQAFEFSRLFGLTFLHVLIGGWSVRGHAVRGPKHVVKTGKTTVLDAGQARKLLDSIRITRTVMLLDGTIKEVPASSGCATGR